MSALKRLQHKEWLILRDLWIDHLPAIDFNEAYPNPTLSQLPKLTFPDLNSSGLSDFPYVEGVRQAIFREAILLARKFIYCASLLPALSQAGRNTWAAVGAYEAAFYGAKTFVFLLGIAPLNRDSKIYIDAFFETERKKGKSKEKVYDTLRAHKLEDRLTHKMLWQLFVRLLDTATLDDERREIQTDLKIIDWNSFQLFRNRIFYDGSYWPLSDSVANCDIVRPAINDHMCDAAFLDNSTSAPFAGEYFSAAALLKRLIASMLESIAATAPALNAEITAFEVLRRPLP